MDTALLTWGGILICLLHSAMFSGLNLGVFGISRLRLEIEAAAGTPAAKRILALRQDNHFLLATVLCGNVAVNCLLTLLMDSVVAGVSAFLISTLGITLFGEIIPQAFFVRHALTVSSFLTPYLKLWQKLLYPVAKPIALLLDGLLGKEGIEYFRERDLRELIKRHMGSEHVDINHIEGLGALNFLAIDDIPVSDEGEALDESSVIRLPRDIDLPRIPAFEPKGEDPFVQRVRASGKRWIVFTDEKNEPLLVLDSNAFLRAVLEGQKTKINAYAYCHRPIVVRDPAMRLGEAITQLTVEAQIEEDDVIDRDLILVWGDEKRVISGADLLGRLLRGIVKRKPLAGDGAVPLPPRRV